jgi:hypothetical protein
MENTMFVESDIKASADEMIVDGFHFETKENGCVWVEGMAVYKFWTANPEQTDDVLNANKKYEQLTRPARKAEQQARDAFWKNHAREAARDNSESQEDRRIYDEL